MTNEELQEEIKRLEEQITNLRFKILESKVDKKPYEVEVPEDIDDYYYTNEYGEVDYLEGYSSSYEKNKYIRGLAFKTEEEAERYDKERILLFKMYKWAEEQNEGWTPDWQKGIPKYFAMFNRVTGEFSVGADCYCRVFTKLPYFKSDDLAEQFIEEFGDEIKEVLC
nr:MAG TPA: Proliferating cell nuclear antigen, PCNA-associated, p15, p15PAF, PAF15, crystal.9A [Caudoviricetes sp.]